MNYEEELIEAFEKNNTTPLELELFETYNNRKVVNNFVAYVVEHLDISEIETISNLRTMLDSGDYNLEIQDKTQVVITADDQSKFYDLFLQKKENKLELVLDDASKETGDDTKFTDYKLDLSEFDDMTEAIEYFQENLIDTLEENINDNCTISVIDDELIIVNKDYETEFDLINEHLLDPEKHQYNNTVIIYMSEKQIQYLTEINTGGVFEDLYDITNFFEMLHDVIIKTTRIVQRNNGSVTSTVTKLEQDIAYTYFKTEKYSIFIR